MPSLQNYNYRARTGDNRVVTGVVQAVGVDDARKILIKSQLVPLAITVPKTLLDYLPFAHGVPSRDIALFARQLATMINAGLTLAQSLRLLVRQQKKGNFRSVLEAILNDIQDGFSFSSALVKYPNTFSSIFISVVKSGEATGKLEDVLKQLATSLEKEQAVKSKLKAALFYPGFILVAMVGTAVVLLTQVLPQLKDMFTSSGQSLPPQTQFLLDLSDLLVTKGFLVAGGVIVAFIGIRAYLGTESGKQLTSVVMLKVPVAGSIIEQNSMATFGRLLSMLLSSGVPMVDSLKMIRDSYNNRVYKASMGVLINEVERGVPMSVPINNDRNFPMMISQMVAVGEQTGKMDEVMVRLADYYESEVDAKIAGLSSLIEPIVIVILGVAVAWLVTAILLPVYQISSTGV